MHANYLVLNVEIHAYNTSASTDLHVLGPRSIYGQSVKDIKEVCYGITCYVKVTFIYYCFKRNIKKSI